MLQLHCFAQKSKIATVVTVIISKSVVVIIITKMNKLNRKDNSTENDLFFKHIVMIKYIDVFSKQPNCQSDASLKE